jgi:hypothetical protein
VGSRPGAEARDEPAHPARLDHSLAAAQRLQLFARWPSCASSARLGWQTVHLTTPKQGAGTTAGGGRRLEFSPHAECRGRGLLSPDATDCGSPAGGRADDDRPDLIHAHSPVLNALPSLWVGRRQRLPVVYEMRASWEDAAVDHGTTQRGQSALPRIAGPRASRCVTPIR